MRSVLALALCVTILFVLSGCGQNPPEQAADTLRVMTYNIHHGADATEHFDLQAVAETIREAAPDVAALQEVDRSWGARSHYLDEAAWLARTLRMHFVFDATLTNTSGGQYGLALLSRYPIAGSDFSFLPGELEQRGVLLAWVEAPRGLIPVACTHLGLSVSDRAQQAVAVAAWLPDWPDVVLLGDLAAEPDAPELAPLMTRPSSRTLPRALSTP